MAADVLQRLAVYTGEESYRRRAIAIMRLVTESLLRYPSGFGRVLGALDFYLSAPKEIAIIGQPGDPRTKELKREVWQHYLPNRIVALTSPDDDEASELIPLLRDRPLIGGQPSVYVCENYTCKEPVTTVEALAAQLSNRVAGQAG